MRRIAVIEKEKCNPEGCGGYLCIRVSPGNRMGNECFVKGADGKAEVHEEVCTDAEMITAKKCPFGAIHMVKLPEKLTSQPVQRYGRDGFVLYSLPVPMFGKVVGIIGVNGIGKSTALKIIAGVMKPNLGEGKPKEFADLLDYFKGSEAQDFFEKVRDGNIIVAYKPQQVELIPKSVKGTVRQLLQHVDEKKQLETIAVDLDLVPVLDSDIKTISGGELQRVAIAATALKKANLYIFDEPTSYLDIKQRLRVSSFIRNLADAETAVLVVDHDLIVLDSMTDLVHVMYGEEGTYGIVSQPKATRVGINVYLDGYLREENMRFRNHEIRFSVRAPEKIGKKEPLLTWHGIEKTQGGFSVAAAEGSVVKKHTTGILGENGIGKTTFVRILAGELQQDKGGVSRSVTVSYKPQYLAADSDALVAEFLREAIQKYPVPLIGRLNLEHLLQRKLNELSGGELQRAFIARCLSADADLFLLDEPSAYLDVEQRINIAKLVREQMEQRGRTALVVDHDLLFIDTLSDDLLVFEGTPAMKGEVHGPFAMEDGMNHFLRSLGITLRRDKDSNRPRINKEDSRLDREQKNSGKLYYG